MVEYADLDLEWVELLLEAKSLGITEEEIRSFFSEASERGTLVRK
ncbi:anti-repressor SinI family protein [Sutcliffiella rhizosphaerae]|uniref:Sin domain-containing protein n=1 Tax=Sutcliffiella rhizosphaerae TaxID=2880967 RepID=A0ABM8YL89_9BACI|nr:anti-repressor SinI family protein [Sutcliffiella rhizosphaerae]CAG9620727.1 hypothetical protein BACCIP111883_01497 [Sutcliffiella rhizosphaerae]